MGAALLHHLGWQLQWALQGCCHTPTRCRWCCARIPSGGTVPTQLSGTSRRCFATRVETAPWTGSVRSRAARATQICGARAAQALRKRRSRRFEQAASWQHSAVLPAYVPARTDLLQSSSRWTCRCREGAGGMRARGCKARGSACPARVPLRLFSACKSCTIGCASTQTSTCSTCMILTMGP